MQQRNSGSVSTYENVLFLSASKDATRSNYVACLKMAFFPRETVFCGIVASPPLGSR
jgi:hypothetical protein